MRIKEIQPFDASKEYAPGERVIYAGMVIIAALWTATAQRFANDNPAMFTQRCARCKIKREDCPTLGLQCDKYRRSDRKTIYWRFLRMAKGYKGVETLEFNFNGTIAGVRIDAAPDNENK